MKTKKTIQSLLTTLANKSLLAGIVSSGIQIVAPDNLISFPAQIHVNSLNGNNGFWVSGKEANAESGGSVNEIGDFNGDGIGDFLIGAHQTDANNIINAGQAYVIFGSLAGFPQNLQLQNLNGVNGFAISGIQSDGLLSGGVSGSGGVGGGGDVDGDGLKDIVLAADQAGPSPSMPGRVYVIFGSKNPFPANFNVSLLNGANGFSVTGEWPNNNYPMSLGSSVAITKDINGDGLDEVLIGAITANHFEGYEEVGGPATAGAAYVIFGSEDPFPADIPFSLINGYGFTVNGLAAYDHLGRAVNGAGDINGDGFNDIVLGANGASPNGMFAAGQAYVIFGGLTNFWNVDYFDLKSLNGINGFVVNGKDDQDQLGWDADSAGDFNGDGIGDLLIGADFANPNGINSGQAYIIFGSKAPFPAQLNVGSLNGNNGVSLDNPVVPSITGFKVSSAGDVNGDGIGDVMVGARSQNKIGAQFVGRSFVVFGKSQFPFPPSINMSQLNGTDGFCIIGNAYKDYACIVNKAGDINGDGVDDMMVGASRVDISANLVDAGRTYIIFGEQPNTGDVDGDNQADLILQLKSRVTAALMTNGYYTGIKKDLITFNDLKEQVVAVNDFDLDGVTDLATQSGSLVRLRKGPAYGVVSSFNLLSDYNVIASGNIRGTEVNGKKGYPELIIVKSPTPPIGKDYYYSLNKGNWVFTAPQFLYTHNGYNPIVGAGRFIFSNIQTNRYDEAMMYSYFGNLVNKDLYARQSSFTPNDKSKFLMTMYQDEVLGAGNFKLGSGSYEFIWSHSNMVYFSQSFSGYKLPLNEKVVGPK